MSGDLNAPYSGKGRNGLILTGHDHTGCDVLHYVDRKIGSDSESGAAEGEHISDAAWSWNAKKYPTEVPAGVLESINSDAGFDSAFTPTPAIREVTLRSMMGEFDGNAGLLSVWFDAESSQEWKYEITTCQLGIQHIWWVIHIVALATLIAALTWVTILITSSRSPLVDERRASKGATEEKKNKDSGAT